MPSAVKIWTWTDVNPLPVKIMSLTVVPLTRLLADVWISNNPPRLKLVVADRLPIVVVVIYRFPAPPTSMMSMPVPRIMA